MNKAFGALCLLAAAASFGACSSKAFYGGMIGAGVGGLNDHMVSGAMIGAGVGGMIDELEDDEPKQDQGQNAVQTPR
jgi:hypothetical protein